MTSPVFRYLFFNFEVRTEDNVRLRLEGTIFWQAAPSAQAAA